MELKENAYKMTVSMCGFDINAGQNIDSNKTLKEMIDYVFTYVNEGNKGCCFHASVYLMKLLHVLGLESEIILTVEPTKLENGEERIDTRASILLKDGDKYIVMNPIEDIEFFEKNGILKSDRDNYYDENSTILKGKKEGISSVDAGGIELEDFIKRYGNGTSWTIGSLFRSDYDTMTFGELMKTAKVIDIGEYGSNKTI